MERHVWTERDDLAALYIYKYGEPPGMSIAGIASERGMSADSLKMRVGNFKAIGSGSGLEHAAKQSEDVLGRYADLPQGELYKLAFS